MLRAMPSQRSFAEPVDRERQEFKRLYRVTFVFFFLIALVTRLLPRAWRPLASSAGGAESPYAEARRAAYTALPFVFMR